MRTPASRWVRSLAPLLAPVAMVVVAWPLLWPMPAVADNFQFWFAGHILAGGQSPYDNAAWESAASYGRIAGGIAVNTVPADLPARPSAWIYPPHAAFLFVPFGALPLEVGIPLLRVFVLITAVVGLAAAAYVAGLRGGALAVFLSLAVVSQPFVVSVRNGHPIGLLVLGAALVYAGLRDRRIPLIALGAVLLSWKPQLVLPLAAGVALILASRRDWPGLLATTAALGAAILPAQLVTPFPLADLTARGGDLLGKDLSTTGALARDLGGGLVLTPALAALAVSACLFAAWATTGAMRGLVLFGGGLVASIALAPYVHDYDLLLCIPAGAVAFAVSGRGRGPLSLVAMAVVIVPWLLFYTWPLLGQPNRVYLGGPLGAVAIVFALLLAAAALLARAEVLSVRRMDRQVTTTAS